MEGPNRSSEIGLAPEPRVATEKGANFASIYISEGACRAPKNISERICSDAIAAGGAANS